MDDTSRACNVELFIRSSRIILPRPLMKVSADDDGFGDTKAWHDEVGISSARPRNAAIITAQIIVYERRMNQATGVLIVATAVSWLKDLRKMVVCCCVGRELLTGQTSLDRTDKNGISTDSASTDQRPCRILRRCPPSTLARSYLKRGSSGEGKATFP